MTWFYNLSVGRKLGLGFGLCILLAAAIAASALRGIAGLAGSVHSYAVDTVPGLVSLSQLRASSRGYRLDLSRLAVNDDPKKIQAIKAQLDADGKAVEDALASYGKACFQPKDRELFAATTKAWAAYHDKAESIRGPLEKRSGIEAVNYVEGQTSALFDEGVAPANKALTAFNEESAKHTAAEAAATVASARTIVVGALLVALAIGVASALLVTRAIKRPALALSERLNSLADHCVKGLSEGLEAFAAADLTVDVQPVTTPVPIEGKDEIGRMSETFNGMLAKIQGTVLNYNRARADLGAMVQEIAGSAGGVRETSGGLAAAAQQGGIASGEIAQGSEKLATSATESAATMQDLVRSMEDLSEAGAAIESVAQSARGMADEASRGNAAVERTVQAMRRVRLQVETSSAKVAELDAKGKQIGQIVKTIETIAEQTNLLALNAAIEAARAGEHGRGFAVVADEVRKLAEQSAVSTREIAALVEGVSEGVIETVSAIQATRGEVEESAEATDAAGDALERIVAAARGVMERSQDVAESSRRTCGVVVEGNGLVATSITNVAAISEETAAGAEELSATIEEIAASAQELSSMSEQLDAMVARFVVEKGGAARGRTNPLRFAA